MYQSEARALRAAILRHRDSYRPSQRRPHDEVLYSALAEICDVPPEPLAAEQLRRQRDYYEGPYDEDGARYAAAF